MSDQTITIAGVTFSGSFGGPWPELPYLRFRRHGTQVQNMPSLSQPGQIVHLDFGTPVSSGQIDITIPRCSQEQLDDLMAEYLGGPGSFVVAWPGHSYTCVWRPNEVAVDPRPHAGFPGYYGLEVRVNIVQ